MKILILKICLWSLLCCQSLADLPGWENVRINMNNIGPTVYGANSITHAIVTNIPHDYHDFYYIWHVNEDIFSFQVYHAYNETKYIYQWDSDDIGMNTVHVCLFKGPFTMIKCNSTKVLVNSHLQVNFKVQRTSGSWLQTDIFPLGTVNISCSLIDPSAFFENSTITYNWTTGDGRGYTNASLNASYWTTQHKYITTGLHVLKVNVSTTGPNSAKYYGIATENITIYGN
ncbi:uncharacterized protein TRIADDRAFT_53686 [Trichoplax adhaerens]|uniref:PKD domain-containing protein n=1 Tax=Trichoplax adhaerens TaxID=10228 RepID=B3RPW4_TRIAD|nr:predicted protein [Trichoplax adhaerens]EDV27713.1 predicted protein [Trichoplax adhaerens]|eukprot:XP_002109547.1 predicted protein [Trichoplax adhaerens]